MDFITNKDIYIIFNKMYSSTLTNYYPILYKYGINEETKKINITISLTQNHQYSFETNVIKYNRCEQVVSLPFWSKF